MHEERCICGLLPSIRTETRLLIIAHRREIKKTTSTAHLAALCLESCALHVRGDADEHFDPSPLLDPERRALVLFPSDDAQVLTPELLRADPRPITLVVPDGSWRQAARIPRRVPVVKDLPRVILPPGPETRFFVRQDTRPGGLATLEAIARCLGIIEDPGIQAQLEAVFEAMVERTMDSRRGIQPGHS